MKTTVDIPSSVLEEAIRHANARTKREAILLAVAEFNRRRRLAEVVQKFGTFDGFPSSEELARSRDQG